MQSCFFQDVESGLTAGNSPLILNMSFRLGYVCGQL